MRLVLYLVFVLSGAARLIYASMWSRYVGLFVGHSAYAQIVVFPALSGSTALLMAKWTIASVLILLGGESDATTL